MKAGPARSTWSLSFWQADGKADGRRTWPSSASAALSAATRVLEHAVAGLRLVTGHQAQPVDASTAAELRAAIFDAAPAIAEAAEPRIDAGTVWMGLAAAAALADADRAIR